MRGYEAEQPASSKLRRRARWEEAVAAVERIKGEPWAAFRDRRRDWGRDVVLYLGRKHCGLRLKELGKLAGGLDYRSVGWAVDRLAKQAAKDKALKKLLVAAGCEIQNPET